ncbi:MAG: peptide deformylase, partial [Emcibacteraceae bacterium]|nr:peptide deformylase [Emcibacteraceae bacterium]
PIFQKQSDKIENIDESVKLLCEALEALLYEEGAVGVAATMIGDLRRVISYDLQEDEERNPITMINPKIIEKSEETQEFEEGSICFPGTTLKVIRPKLIKLEYMNVNGDNQLLEADGWLSTVIQHEIDYLDGKTIFDDLSPMKKKMQFKKVKKFMKLEGY